MDKSINDINVNILLDCNAFDYILEKISLIKDLNLNFYYIWSQEIELEKISDLNKLLKIKEIKKNYTLETAGVFMINAPCINKECFFPNSEVVNTIKRILIKHKCLKNHRDNNFKQDLNLAITAYINKFMVLTNDGSGKKDGLLKALKEMSIKCYSTREFEKIFLGTGGKNEIK